MGLRLVVLILFGTSRCLATEDKKCFAPVMCSVEGGSQQDWLQVFPPPQCHWTEQANSYAKGLKGEKGDQDIRGEKGSQGEPGIADNTVTDALSQEIISLQTKVDAQEKQNVRMNMTIKAQQAEIISLQTQGDELEKQNARMNLTLQNMNLTNKAQQAEISGLAAEFAEFKEKFNKTESAQSGQSIPVQKIQADVTEISSRLNAMEPTVELLAEFSDWYKILHGNQTFMYRRSNDLRNYTAAKERCTELGTRLACVGMRIPEVRKYVIDGLVRITGADTWIGLENLTTVGHWMWSDGVSSTIENTAWAPGEPNLDGRCGQMRWNKNHLFVNPVCSETKRYICEKVA